MKLRAFKYSKIAFVIWLAILICWMGFILSKSLEDAEKSSASSQGVVEVIEEAIQKIEPDFEISNHFVRKLAHFVEFFILGFIFTLSYYIVLRDYKYHLCLSLLFGLLFSLIDESFQLLSFGRSAAINDVWLDFSAVITSVLIFALINLFINRKKSL